MGKSHSPKIFIFSYIYYNCECTDSVHNKRIPALMALAGDKEKIMSYKIFETDKNGNERLYTFSETKEEAQKICNYLNIVAFLKRNDKTYQYYHESFGSLPLCTPKFPTHVYVCAVVHKYSAFPSWVEFKEGTRNGLKITIGQKLNIVDGMKVPIDDFKNLHHLECEVFRLLYRYQKGLDVEQ